MGGPRGGVHGFSPRLCCKMPLTGTGYSPAPDSRPAERSTRANAATSKMEKGDDMSCKLTWRPGGVGAIVLWVAAGTLAAGCSSSKEPKPMQQPSVQDVRGNADRAFDKLKQEEKQRDGAAQPGR